MRWAFLPLLFFPFRGSIVAKEIQTGGELLGSAREQASFFHRPFRATGEEFHLVSKPFFVKLNPSI